MPKNKNSANLQRAREALAEGRKARGELLRLRVEYNRLEAEKQELKRSAQNGQFLNKPSRGGARER